MMIKVEIDWYNFKVKYDDTVDVLSKIWRLKVISESGDKIKDIRVIQHHKLAINYFNQLKKQYPNAKTFISDLTQKK